MKMARFPHYSKETDRPSQSVGSDRAFRCDSQAILRHLVSLSELQRRFDILPQFSPEFSGDLNRRSGFVVVGYLCSPTDCELHPSGSTNGIIQVPLSVSTPPYPS